MFDTCVSNMKMTNSFIFHETMAKFLNTGLKRAKSLTRPLFYYKIKCLLEFIIFKLNYSFGLQRVLHIRGLKLYVNIFKLVCDRSKNKNIFYRYSLMLSMTF